MSLSLSAVIDVNWLDDPPFAAGMRVHVDPFQCSMSGHDADPWMYEPASQTSVSLSTLIAVTDVDDPPRGPGIATAGLDRVCARRRTRCQSLGRPGGQPLGSHDHLCIGTTT